MNELFTFGDVLIVPKFSSVASRRDVELGSSLGKRFDIVTKLPIISSNMDTVTGPEMSQTMLKAGGQACLHRFGSIDETVATYKKSHISGIAPFVSIGLGELELSRAHALWCAGATDFVIDVANGAQLEVVKQAKSLRLIVGDHGSITVGNFATGESVKTFLEHSGDVVDAFKVGIGPGSACTTRVKTGVGYPQLSAILDIAKTLKRTGLGIIADGGMKTPGDIAKALGAGAHMVMLGGMLAGTDETPGDLYTESGRRVVEIKDGMVILDVRRDDSQSLSKHIKLLSSVTLGKKYRGSASQESYEAQGKAGSHRTSEGESFMVPYKGPVADILKNIEGGLRSAFTYVGAKNMDEFHSKVEFVRISGATQVENCAHGRR